MTPTITATRCRGIGTASTITIQPLRLPFHHMTHGIGDIADCTTMIHSCVEHTILLFMPADIHCTRMGFTIIQDMVTGRLRTGAGTAGQRGL